MATFLVTDNAARRIHKVLSHEPEGSFLRVSVNGGGCSGFQYAFSIDQSLADDDLIVEKNGITVAVDAVSQPFVDGATLDFLDDLMGQYFKVDNPNASASCGCGMSFSL
jgi:iron-sulfur cluster assembly accessory protein